LPETGDYDSGGETGLETLERHYRVTLDFRVLVRAITEEVCRESLFSKDLAANDSSQDLREQVERQRRLYNLLRKDRPTLEQYLLSVVTLSAVRRAADGLADAFDAREEDDLLIPLYRGMAEEDAEFFEECRKSGVLAENTELIAAAFKVEWLGAEVAEMSRRVVGDVKRAEAIEQTKTRLIRAFNSSGRTADGLMEGRLKGSQAGRED
jgi:hypothetical protein